MFNFFTKKAEKREVDNLKQAVQTGFNSTKQDVNNLSKWIKHLDVNDSKLKEEIFEIKDGLSTVKDDIENLKNMLSIVSEVRMFKQQQPLFNKQTSFKGVLNTVQTGVQTVFLDNLSTTERAIVFVLLNSDMKLSYEDLAAMLGKRKTTIRGQINSIRQKRGGLIEEIVGENNKKRVFIPNQTKNILLKGESMKRGRKNEK